MKFSDQITHKRTILPPRFVVHGPAGIGKTTLAGSANDALLIPVEDGAGLLQIASLPAPNCWDDLANMLREIIEDLQRPESERTFMGNYKTLILDSIDRVEPFIWKAVCQDPKHKKDEIEDFGYGKGYTYCDSYWIRLLQGLDMIRREGITVIIIAHTAMLTVDDPIVGSYSRFAPKIHKRANALLTEWSDIVGFLDIARQPVDKGDGLRKTRTSTVQKTGGNATRTLWLEDAGGFVAKNRYGLPACIAIPKDDGFAVLYEEMEKAIGTPTVGSTDGNGKNQKEEK